MTQISTHVYQISLGIVNCFVVEDNGLTLIDTGTKNSKEQIFSAIKKAGKNPDDIRQIILTHAHPDHSGSAASIKQALNIPVLAHRLDAELLEKGLAGRMKTGGVSIGLSPGIINWFIYNLFIKRAGMTVDPVVTDRFLEDNEILPIAGGIRIIHTPGHSAGHIALLVEKDSVLIAADICANATGLDLSTVYEDRQLGIESILKASSHKFDVALFGHGNPLTKNASQRLSDKFSKMVKE